VCSCSGYSWSGIGALTTKSSLRFFFLCRRLCYLFWSTVCSSRPQDRSGPHASACRYAQALSDTLGMGLPQHQAGRVATSGTPRAPRRCCSTTSTASGRRPRRPPTEAASGRSSWSQRRRGGQPSRAPRMVGCCITKTGTGRRSHLPDVTSNDRVMFRQYSNACAEKLSRQGPPGVHPARHTRRRSRCDRAALGHLQPASP